MLVLVDGYNVTMRDPATTGLSKEDQRTSLLSRLRVHAATLAPKGTVVVVFDAHSELGHSSESSGQVKVVYAPVADDEIARRCGSPGRIAVVTDDLRLRARISQDIGRHVEFRDGSTVWAATLAQASKRRGGARISRETGLPPGANSITEELKGLWLTEEDE